jgi:hypothetical protein
MIAWFRFVSTLSTVPAWPIARAASHPTSVSSNISKSLLTNGRASGWFLTKSAREICRRLRDDCQIIDEIRTHAHAEIARRRVSGSGDLAISLSQNVVNVVWRKVSRP